MTQKLTVRTKELLDSFASRKKGKYKLVVFENWYDYKHCKINPMGVSGLSEDIKHFNKVLVEELEALASHCEEAMGKAIHEQVCVGWDAGEELYRLGMANKKRDIEVSKSRAKKLVKAWKGHLSWWPDLNCKDQKCPIDKFFIELDKKTKSW